MNVPRRGGGAPRRSLGRVGAAPVGDDRQRAREPVDLACRFHRDLSAPALVGWDLALAPDGPTVVEGNTYWNGAMYMALDDRFKDRYLAAVGAPSR